MRGVVHERWNEAGLGAAASAVEATAVLERCAADLAVCAGAAICLRSPGGVVGTAAATLVRRVVAAVASRAVAAHEWPRDEVTLAEALELCAAPAMGAPGERRV